MATDEPWADLLRAVARNGHIADVALAVACGVPERTFRDRVRRERWHRLRTGTFAPPTVRVDSDHRVRALIRSLGGEVYAAGESALALHGLARRTPPLAHVVVPAHRRPARTIGVTISRSRTLDPTQVTQVRGLPTVTIARALCDLAATWPVERLLGPALEGLQRRRLSAADLVHQRSRAGKGWHGGPRFGDLVVRVLRDGSDSFLESEVRDRLASLPWRPYPRPLPWRAPDGVVCHLDIAYPDRWVAVLCDSRAHHGTGRAFDTDRLAWNSLGASWRLFWATSTILTERTDAFVREVGAALASPDPAGRAPAEAVQCGCHRCLGSA